MPDVLSVAPAFIKQSDTAPVRDAIVAALTDMFSTYEDLATYYAANADVMTAQGPYLDEKLDWERGVRRGTGEADEDYRFRGLGLQQCVTPQAIVAAVNAIIAPATCGYNEPALDRLFLSDGTATWRAYIGSTPDYPDRLYGTRLGLTPLRAGVFSDSSSRFFVITVPSLVGLDTSINSVWDGAGPSVDGLFIYTSDSTNFFNNTTSSLNTYQLIVDTVERLRGASIRWALFVQ